MLGLWRFMRVDPERVSALNLRARQYMQLPALRAKGRIIMQVLMELGLWEDDR